MKKQTYREWWEKESAYEIKWQNGTVAKDLWKYIPQSKQEAVDDVLTDSDGYWVYLNEGWNMDGERTIHCYTIEDLRCDIAQIERTRRKL